MAILNRKRRRTVVTLVMTLSALVALFIVPGTTDTFAQVNVDADSCVLTADLLDGDGLSVGGAGRSFSGSGRSFSGSGRSFSGSGRSFSGSGRSFSGSGRSFSGSASTIEAFLDLLEGNQVDFSDENNPYRNNLLNFLAPVIGSESFNPDREVAIIVLDNDNHGELVIDVLSQYDAILPGNVSIHPVIINGSTGANPDGYSLANVNALLSAKINSLVGTVDMVVINMSFVIVPCEDEAVEVVRDDNSTTTIVFDFDVIEETVSKNDEFQEVNGILECVVDNDDGTLTAHFGYENPNNTATYIPHGEDNFLTGGGLSAEELRAATPKYFAKPGVVANRPGRSGFYPNSAFQVTFHAGENDENRLVWNLFGRTETASADSDPCFNDSVEDEYFRYIEDDNDDGGESDGTPEPEEEVTVPDYSIFVECVSELEDGGFVAHFGYEIRNNVGGAFALEAGTQSRLSGGGLTDAEKAISTPAHFNRPGQVDGRPGRTQFYPNSAFQIEFDGSNLVWTLDVEGVRKTTTASANSSACLVELGENAVTALSEINPNASEEDIQRGISTVISEAAESENQDIVDFKNFLQAQVDRSDIMVIPVASAGNNKRDFETVPGIQSPGRPSAPAIFPSVIAVSGSFVTPDDVKLPTARWEDSQDGEIMADAGAFLRSGTTGDFVIGTSFATPLVVRSLATFGHIPGACVEVITSEGLRPPVAPATVDGFIDALADDATNADDYLNRPLVAGGPSPFNCFIPQPQEAPTCNGLVANIWVDDNGIIRSTNPAQDGDTYVVDGVATTLIGTNNDDVIVGTDMADTIRGRRGNDTICGLLGEDNINGQQGDDTLFGGSTDRGNDPSDNDTINGGQGMDTIFGGDGNDMLNGREDNDIIRAGSGDDTVRGGHGDDLLVGQNGMDNMRGGDGHDNMFGEAMADTMHGDAGDDTISGQADDDILRGGPGNDVIYGGFPNNPATGTGNDNIRGGEGNDTAIGGDGDDIIRGGNGNDSLIGGATELATDPSGVDNIAGGEGNDIIRGGDMADRLVGDAGDDTIFGGTDNDVIRGNRGNDFLDGDTGDDNISGGEDNDSIFGEPGNDVLSGDNGNDLVNGQAGDDTIRGGHGNDELYGGLKANGPSEVNTGNDIMRGGHGDDSLFGADGDDNLRGQENDDLLHGGPNTDVCRGGTGVDTFVECEVERDTAEPDVPEGE